MYPLPFIFLTGFLKKKTDAIYYALPLAFSGFLIAVYHNLLYYKIIPEVISPCTLTAPCTTQQLLLFGFFTIPLGSLLSFAAIIIAIVFYIVLNKKNEKVKGKSVKK